MKPNTDFSPQGAKAEPATPDPGIVDHNSYSSLYDVAKVRTYSNQNEHLVAPKLTPSGNLSGNVSGKIGSLEKQNQ